MRPSLVLCFKQQSKRTDACFEHLFSISLDAVLRNTYMYVRVVDEHRVLDMMEHYDVAFTSYHPFCTTDRVTLLVPGPWIFLNLDSWQRHHFSHGRQQTAPVAPLITTGVRYIWALCHYNRMRVCKVLVLACSWIMIFHDNDCLSMCRLVQVDCQRTEK